MNTLSLQNTKALILSAILGLAMFTGLIATISPKVAAVVTCPPTLTGNEVLKCEACKGAGATSYTPGTAASGGTAATSGSCETGSAGDTEATVTDIVSKVITIFSFAVGVVSVIMIMVGGFKYVTSQGDANSITSAKNTILYALVGLVIVAFAQIIVRYVLSKI